MIFVGDKYEKKVKKSLIFGVELIRELSERSI